MDYYPEEEADPSTDLEGREKLYTTPIHAETLEDGVTTVENDQFFYEEDFNYSQYSEETSDQLNSFIQDIQKAAREGHINLDEYEPDVLGFGPSFIYPYVADNDTASVSIFGENKKKEEDEINDNEPVDYEDLLETAKLQFDQGIITETELVNFQELFSTQPQAKDFNEHRRGDRSLNGNENRRGDGILIENKKKRKKRSKRKIPTNRLNSEQMGDHAGPSVSGEQVQPDPSTASTTNRSEETGFHRMCFVEDLSIADEDLTAASNYLTNTASEGTEAEQSTARRQVDGSKSLGKNSYKSCKNKKGKAHRQTSEGTSAPDAVTNQIGSNNSPADEGGMLINSQGHTT